MTREQFEEYKRFASDKANGIRNWKSEVTMRGPDGKPKFNAIVKADVAIAAPPATFVRLADLGVTVRKV